MHKGKDLPLRIGAFLVSLFALLTNLAHAADPPPQACAIRWDAFYSNGKNEPGEYTARALSAPKWKSRTPLHGVFDSNGRLEWKPSQSTFDAELRAAYRGRLCWAYLAYGNGGSIDLEHPMMRALAFHRRSAIKSLVPYAIMAQARVLGAGGSVAEAAGKLVELFSDKNYLRVTIEGELRPILFLYYDPHEPSSHTESPVDILGSSLTRIRDMSVQRGLGNPYAVVVTSPASEAERVRARIGAEGISQYIAGQRAGRDMRWTEFERTIEDDWERYLAATAADVVPTLRTGADIRARCDTPPPWSPDLAKNKNACGGRIENPSSAELKYEAAKGRAWLARHRERARARLLLLYSWSECDESGNCLMPTYGDPTGNKIRAIGEAMQPALRDAAPRFPAPSSARN